jgi:hypothetical protein
MTQNQETQVVVALLGSQTNFAEIKIPNHGPGLICVMCQLVDVTWRPPCLFCQPIAITPVNMQTLFTNIALIHDRQDKLDDILSDKLPKLDVLDTMTSYQRLFYFISFFMSFRLLAPKDLRVIWLSHL